MKFDDLLNHHKELLQAARIAHLAYAYHQVGTFAGRIASTGLRGEVVLLGPDPKEKRPLAILHAVGFNQSVIEEHFLQDEIIELHAVLAYVHEAKAIIEMRFRLEDFGAVYLPALRLADVLARQALAAGGEADFDGG